MTPPPLAGSKVITVEGGRAIKGHITAVTRRSIFILCLHDKTPLLFFMDEEGTKWARGWDSETAGALLAAHALLDPPRRAA